MTGRLAAPGRILLVSCYELGHAPHGLAMTAAFLEQAGFHPDAVDLQIDRLDRDRIERAHLIAISVPMHTALRMGIAIARRIREIHPGCHLVMFGLYAPLNADLLRRTGVDSVLGAEHEPELVELARALDRGEPAPGRIAAPLVRLRFPVPSRRGLPALDRYAHLVTGDGEQRAAGYVEASRGCLDQCRHCPVPAVYRGRFFVVDRDAVLDDVDRQVAAGARHITFGDPDFLNGPGHALAIVRELHRRHPELSFDVTAQIVHLLRHRERLAELRELGCAFVVSAVESVEDQVLAALGKQHRRRDFLDALDRCQAADLPLRPTFVPFTPWSTLDGVVELVELCAERDLVDAVAPIQLSVRLLVPPGSLLLEQPALRACFGDLDPEALGHRWHHPDPRMDALAAAIAARCEAALGQGEPPDVTFFAIRDLVRAAAGRAPWRPVDRPRPRRKIPRLSEPWFC